MQEDGFGKIISGNVIGNINDKEFEARMKKEQEQTESEYERERRNS